MSLLARFLNLKHKKRFKMDNNNSTDMDINEIKHHNDLCEDITSVKIITIKCNNLNKKNNNNKNLSYIRKFLCGCTMSKRLSIKRKSKRPSLNSIKSQATTTPAIVKNQSKNTIINNYDNNNDTPYINNQVNIKIIEIKDENEIINIDEPLIKIQHQNECKIIINNNNNNDDDEKNELTINNINSEFNRNLSSSNDLVINEIKKISKNSVKRKKTSYKKKMIKNDSCVDGDDDDDEENTSENDGEINIITTNNNNNNSSSNNNNNNNNNNKFDLKPPTNLKIYQHRGSHQPLSINGNFSVSDGYPKFLTANNILTDRGCIVNIRTGSFNLGCQANIDADNDNNNNNNSTNNNNNNNSNKVLQNSISLNVDGVDYDDDDDNYEHSNSTNFNNKNLIIPSLNVCSVSDDENYKINNSEFNNGENCDNFNENLSDSNNNYINIGINNNNNNIISSSGNLLTKFLSATNNEQLDPYRRCSHDPNIEKLHKTYINNVKLLDVPTPTTSIATLTAVTSSLSICKKSSSDSSFYNENINNNNNRLCNESNNNYKIDDSKDEDDEDTRKLISTNILLRHRDSLILNSKSAELLNNSKSENFNDISKVNEWLSDNHNHYRRIKNLPCISLSTIPQSRKGSKETENNDEVEKDKIESLNQQQQQQQQSQLQSKSMRKIKQKRNVTYTDEKNGEKLELIKICQYDEESDYDDDDDDDDDDDNDEENDNDKNKLKIENSGSIKTKSMKSADNNIDSKKNYMSDTNESNPTGTIDLETIDSAVDIESYDTMSSISKGSSKSRTNWQSFSKNYHLHFFHSTTWSKYQISAMSLDQIMALRKLALIQFSKLVERQHSSVIRTFRLFSKKRDVEEFKRVYDIQDISNSKPSDINNISDATNSVNNKNSSTIQNNNKSIKFKKQKYISDESSCETNTALNPSTVGLNTITSIGGTSCSTNNATIIATSAINTVSTTFNVITTSVTKSLRPCDLRASTCVFGLPLHIIMQRTGQPLPQKIIEAMKILRKLAPRAIGIFRKNGVKTRINKLKESIDKNEEFSFHLFYTLYDIADMIKLYFRLLPECLITNKLSDILLANYDKVSAEERKLILQQVMLLIPDESRLALQTLLLFLNDIAKHSKTNQMTRSNLAVCFSPVLFHLNIEPKKKKSYHRNRKNQNSSSRAAELLESSNKDDSPVLSHKNIQNDGITIDEPSTSTSNNLAQSLIISSKQQQQQTPIQNKKSLLPQQTLELYKRKCSQTLNKAASSLANFSAGIVDMNNNGSTPVYTDAIEDISKVGQLCVSDMIKYSMDLFTVPIENFEKLKLSLFIGSEPYDLEYYYDTKEKKLKKEEFFKSNLNMQKLYWSYYDKFEDISIYSYKNEQLQQLNQPQHDQIQQFNEKLKLWKCVTLIKQQNITLEKILQRISNERLLWDDDFKEGKLIEKLDSNTDTYKYVISLMPPHPSRDFTEIRHSSKPNDSTLIYTTTSFKCNDRLIGDIRANMIMSKYVIEKLIDNEYVNTFKITHLMKLDYKGFTIEFYNKSLGYLMARLLHRLKLSFNN